MPRKRVVSRVVQTTSASCLMIDLKSKEQFRKTFVLCGHLTRDNINKRGERLFSTKKQKFVTCLRATQHDDFYAMPEEEFILLAKKIKKEKE